MVSSIANSLGAGSGIDVSQLVSDLAAASREPKIARLDKRQSTVKAQISALGQARSDLENFTDSLASVIASGSLRTQPQLSSDMLISATLTSGSLSDTVSVELDVLQLARAQTLTSNPISSATGAIGQGTLTLTVGGQDHIIVIDEAHDSLTGLATAINNAASGVSAQVRVENGSYQLVLKGKMGAANSFSLAGLADFEYPAASGGLTQAQAAQDAVLKIDGVPYQRPSNILTDVLPGLTFTLKKAAPGEITSLRASRPTDMIRTTVMDFVSAFNDLRKNLAKARSSTSSRAVFELERKLSRLLAQPLTSTIQGPRSLADLGVATLRDGSVTVDAKRLTTALKDFPEAVEALFVPVRDDTHNSISDPGIGGAMEELRSDVLMSDGGLDALKGRLQKEVDAINVLKSRTEAREAAYQERLARNFSSMESRVTALRATQSYLTQQIAQWNRSS